MKKFALLLILVLVSIPGLCLASGNDKYQNLFYSKGMPTEEGPLGRGPTVYKYYSEAKIPGKHLLFVLYSKKIQGKSFYSDYKHKAFLSIVKKMGSKLTIISTIDVTHYMTDSIDECNECFARMAGNLDIIPLKDDRKILHLNIGSTISGTGGDSNSSDTFFLVDSINNKLIPALELLDTSSFARAGAFSVTYSSTFLYFQRDEIKGTKILTQKYKYDFDQREKIDSSILDPNINVYEYDFNKNKFVSKGVISVLPSDVSAIKQSYGMPIKDPNTPCCN